MQFIISTSFDNIQPEGSFFWGEKYFPDIKEHLPVNTVEIISVSEGLIYFNKTTLKDKPALRIKITKSHLTKVYLKIYYKIMGESEYKSYQVRNALKQYFNKKSLLELPYCCIVDKDKFEKIISAGNISFDIDNHFRSNNWIEIYKILERHFPLEQSDLWNDAEVLNKFSFATAKLSECTENLKKKFPDEEKRKQFIKSKKHFRELTIKLRQRCIELSPNNASYCSNLAYTFYQSVNELNMPNGRRDGNLLHDAEKAIQYFDKALSIDAKRINDMYRKGILLSEILPDYTLYKISKDEDSNNTPSSEVKYNSAIKSITMGIDELIKLTNTYENFDSQLKPRVKSEFNKNHYKKYYVKALYHIAQKTLKIARLDFNLINLLYGYSPLQYDNQNISDVLNNLNLANNYLEKCIINDYNKKKEEKYLIDFVECDNFIPAVYKSYLKALIETYLYTLTKKSKHLIAAKEFYYKALELNFPRELSNQSKIFIKEKLSVLNLIEGKYEAAIKMLEPLYTNSINSANKKRFPDYAAFTLTIALILDGDLTKAEKIIEENIKCGNKIFEYKFSKLKEYLLRKENRFTNKNSSQTQNL